MEDRIRKSREDREIVDLPVKTRADQVRGGSREQDTKRSGAQEQADK